MAQFNDGLGLALSVYGGAGEPDNGKCIMQCRNQFLNGNSVAKARIKGYPRNSLVSHDPISMQWGFKQAVTFCT